MDFLKACHTNIQTIVRYEAMPSRPAIALTYGKDGFDTIAYRLYHTKCDTTADITDSDRCQKVLEHVQKVEASLREQRYLVAADLSTCALWGFGHIDRRISLGSLEQQITSLRTDECFHSREPTSSISFAPY